MDQFTVVVIIGACALLFGLIVGLIIGRSGSDSQERNQLKSQLDATTLELEQYKSTVNDHFARTAELVNSLTDSYREVHQHLATSAEQLCDSSQLPEQLQQPLHSSAQAEQSDTENTEEAPVETGASVEPPKDYAPKPAPDAEGTLSESFGLQNEEPEEHDPSKTADHAKA